MDIDDILASVSGDTIPQEFLDLQALTRAWVAERTAPELLPYPTALIERVNGRIAKQISRIEDLTSAMDPQSNFSLVVIQTELERVKFLMRSFLRARIAKIDKHPLHYLSLAQSQAQAQRSQSESQAQTESQFSDDISSVDGGSSRPGVAGSVETQKPLLAPTEYQYCQHHTALLSSHYAASFLGSFPPALQKMDDTGGGISMIETPDLDTAVFVRVLRDAGIVEVYGEQGTGEVELKRGDVWVLRWRAVRDGVRSGDLEML